MSADFFGRIDNPANRALPMSSSRSSTWETRRVAVSFSASRDSSRLDRGMAPVPGSRPCRPGGQVEGDQVGDEPQQPGQLGVDAAGQGGEVDPPAAGRRVSRPGGGRAGARLRARAGGSRPNPSSVRIWPRWRGGARCPRWRAAALISYADRPASAQRDDAGAGGVFGWRGALWDRACRAGEELQLSRPGSGSRSIIDHRV